MPESLLRGKSNRLKLQLGVIRTTAGTHFLTRDDVVPTKDSIRLWNQREGAFRDSGFSGFVRNRVEDHRKRVNCLVTALKNRAAKQCADSWISRDSFLAMVKPADLGRFLFGKSKDEKRIR